jgi:hypothetical protein
MTDLVNLFAASTPKASVTYEGRVVGAPATGNDDLFVTIEGFDNGEHKWGPCRFTPKAGELPELGDLVLVVFADTGDPWIASWWNGSDAIGAGGGSLDGGIPSSTYGGTTSVDGGGI